MRPLFRAIKRLQEMLKHLLPAHMRLRYPSSGLSKKSARYIRAPVLSRNILHMAPFIQKNCPMHKLSGNAPRVLQARQHLNKALPCLLVV